MSEAPLENIMKLRLRSGAQNRLVKNSCIWVSCSHGTMVTERKFRHLPLKNLKARNEVKLLARNTVNKFDRRNVNTMHDQDARPSKFLYGKGVVT